MEEEFIEGTEENLPEPKAVESNQINTRGRWVKYSEYRPLEDGKSYHMTFDGDCMVALSKTTPVSGMKVPSLDFTKTEGVELWIKTAK